MSTLPLLIAGRGRLGQRIASHIADGADALHARIDPARGLLAVANSALPVADQALPVASPDAPLRIERLLICLVPRHPDGGSGWLGLLDGLVAQVAAGTLAIARVVHVSSSSVYEGYPAGWVGAHTPARPLTARTEGLVAAENAVRALAADSAVVRLTGITGPGYERYQPLAYAGSEAKHAIDVRDAASAIAALLQPGPAPFAGAHTELLTDGRVYFRDQTFDLHTDRAALDALAHSQRLQSPSQICRSHRP